MPKTIANVTTLPRVPAFSLPRPVAVMPTAEIQPFANYVATLRAVNPTRAIAQLKFKHPAFLVYKRSDTKLETSAVENFVTPDIAQAWVTRGILSSTTVPSGLADYYAVLSSIGFSAARETRIDAITNEEKWTETARMRELQKALVTAKDFSFNAAEQRPLMWMRTFRTMRNLMTEVPISPILDALGPKLYSLYGKPTGTGVESLAADIIAVKSAADLKAWEHLNLAAALHDLYLDKPKDEERSAGHLTEAPEFSYFWEAILALELLHDWPRLQTFMGEAKTDLLAVDPDKRLEAVKHITALQMFMSLTPVLFYGHALVKMLDEPAIREPLTTYASGLYEEPAYLQFRSRFERPLMSPIAAHVLNSALPHDAQTRYGTARIVRYPSGLHQAFKTWDELYGSTAASVVATGVSTPGTAVTAGGTATAILSVIHKLMELSGTNSEWEAISAAASTLRRDAAVGSNPVDWLNPALVMTDGYQSSEPVGYAQVASGLHISPLAMRNGGPSKVALAPPSDTGVSLKAADLGVETAVAAVFHTRRYTEAELKRLVTTAKDPLALTSVGSTDDVLWASPLWVVRESTSLALYRAEAKATLGGRRPLSFYVGDLDAFLMPHSSFESFAHDLGMSPEALGALLTGTGSSYAFPVGLRAAVAAFIVDHTVNAGTPGANGSSIFANPGAGAKPYGLGPDSYFRYKHYFTSARTRAAAVGTRVQLLQHGLPLETKLAAVEHAYASQRTHTAFVVLTADPIQPVTHQRALASVPRFDEELVASWGTSLVMPRSDAGVA